MDLNSFFASGQQPDFLYDQHYVEGCLFGACACPEIPLPDVWLPWTIKHHKQIKSAEEADYITDMMFAYFKQILKQINQETYQPPQYLVYDDANKENLARWCTGVLTAHSAQEKVWQHAWQKMQQQAPETAPKLAKDLQHCLLMFTTFAEPDKATISNKQDCNEDPQKVLPKIAKSLPITVQTYLNIAGELAGFLPNQFETFSQKPN